MKFFIDNEEYLPQEEVEKLLDIKQTSLNTLVRFGHFPSPIKLEIRKLWKKSDVDGYLQEHKQKG